MAAYDFTAPRLFVDQPLAAGAQLTLDRGQANYLVNVLRKRTGEAVLVFNGRDGEWRARLAPEGRRGAGLTVEEQTRPQTPPLDLLYLFAPLKSARLDYMVQKAVEMGAGQIRPVLTRRTQAARVNLERMRANGIEAAEQCGILSLPEVLPPLGLIQALGGLEPDRLLVFCDEDAPVRDPVAALRAAAPEAGGLALVVGPEGGFHLEERSLILRRRALVRLSLGPRILRADTAAVAALALVQAVLGDGRGAEADAGAGEPSAPP